MHRESSRNPGTGAWFVLNLLTVALPTVVLVLVSVADTAHLNQTFSVIVGYSLVLLIAFTIFAATIGTLIFQRIWPGPWELVEGIVLGLIMLGAIGAGLSRYIHSPNPTEAQLATWFGIQVAILLGVLFYSSALKSWTIQQAQEQLNNDLADAEAENTKLRTIINDLKKHNRKLRQKKVS